MLHPKCKDKTRRSVELARARTRCVHPVVSVPTGMKKILTDSLGTRFIIISSVRPPRHESKLFSSFQVRVRGLELDVGWLGSCPRAPNWSRSVECARPAMSSSLETVGKIAKHEHIQQSLYYQLRTRGLATSEERRAPGEESLPESPTRPSTRGLLTWAYLTGAPL